MSSIRTVNREFDRINQLFNWSNRINRVLIRLARAISEPKIVPSFNDILVLCQTLSPPICMSYYGNNASVDNFLGGILLYFWLIVEGEQWIRRLIKQALQVTYISQFILLLAYFYGFFSRPKSTFLCQVRRLIPPPLPKRLMELPSYRARFKTWLISRLGTLRPRLQKLRLRETLELKSKGLSSNGVAVIAERTRCY